MLGGVFISYRREDSAGFAGRIYDRLTRRLDPKSVFLDVDNIQPGLDFFDVLSEKLRLCDALIAVIGKNWNSVADQDNRRRLDDPDDFVRIEIEAALQRGIRVIPVLVDGATMPRREDLPDSLQKLRRRQAIEISHNRFDSDVERLTHALSLIEEELRHRDAAEAERAAREEREKQEAAEAAEKMEQVRRQAEAEMARRVEEERRTQNAAEAERVAREEREQREAAEAAEKVAEARTPVEAEAARQSKVDDTSGLFSGTRAIEAMSAPRSPPVRTYSPILAVAIAVGIAAVLAILVATFGSPAWKFAAPEGDKLAEQAAADEAAADKAAANKAAVDKTVADKAAAEKAAAEKAAVEKAAGDKAAADKAAADRAAADKAAADKAAADKAAADKAAADKVAADGAAAENAGSESPAADCDRFAVGSSSAAEQVMVSSEKAVAACWAALKADPANPRSQYQLALAYAGQGSYDKAIPLLRQAAEAGYPPAQTKIGGFYRDGKGVKQDYNQAMAWYVKAVNQGDSEARTKMNELTVLINYIVQVNDVFPQSAAIIASLKKQNIRLSGTFDSTSSGNRTKPDKLVIGVGPDFPIDILQQIIKICLDNGLDGLQVLSDQRDFNTVVIGSLAYEGYTPINEQTKSNLLSSSLTWPQLVQLIAVSSPNYIVQVNDLFPQSAQIIASLKKQNIQLSGTFGSTSIGDRTKPHKFVLAIAPGFPIDTFQRIFRVCIENGLDGLTIISGQPNFYSIYIGAFAYEPYTPITEQLKSDLLSSGLTWSQLKQLVTHADQ